VLDVLIRPARYFRAAIEAEAPSGSWRRVWLLLLVCGSVTSAFASGRLTPRLIADGAVSFAFIPLIEIVALFGALRVTGARPRLPRARVMHIFFAGNVPWLVWLIALGAILAAAPPRALGWPVPLFTTALVPGAWSAWIDYHFFRQVTGRAAGRARLAVAVNRTFGWTAGVAYFFGIALWSWIAPLVPWDHLR
jgi:hypothetical protein